MVVPKPGWILHGLPQHFCIPVSSTFALLSVELLQVLSIYWFLSTLMFSFFVLP